MLFNSPQFLIFFPVVTLIYFAITHRFRWIWLLISSYYFYMSWNPKYAILIATSTFITYLSGLLLERADNIKDDKKSLKFKKLCIIGSFSSNLGILFLFKYYNFFVEYITRGFGFFSASITLPSFDYLLPVGISFYTFQALSYTMDVYRKDTKAEKNLGKYALFVSFFPQLVAGPIEKSKDLLYQFEDKHYFEYERVKNGLLLMLWGFFQKIFVADRLAILVNTVYSNPQDYKGFQIIVATFFFAFQIYCDFSSYSDIAIGAAQVMGFNLTRNFRQPYFSKSIKEFWRRWHITLGAWFKDYLYIPLGGNRRGKLRNYLNIMIVFIVSGLWHGAAINFVIWGTLHGVYQVVGDILKPLRENVMKRLNVRKDVFSHRLFQTATTFILVNFAWIFFRASSFTKAKILVKNLFNFNPWVLFDGSLFELGLDSKDFGISILGIIIVVIVNLLQRNRSIRGEISKQNIIFRWSLYLVGAFSIIIFGVYGFGFSAQQFIYFQF